MGGGREGREAKGVRGAAQPVQHRPLLSLQPGCHLAPPACPLHEAAHANPAIQHRLSPGHFFMLLPLKMEAEQLSR